MPCRIPLWPFVVIVKAGLTARLETNAGEDMPQYLVAIQHPENYARMMIVLFVVLGWAYEAVAQDAATAYPKMAPIEQYLMTDQNAEIALARSAAPESISRDSDAMVLARNGFVMAVKGKNGFVCIVGRGWS